MPIFSAVVTPFVTEEVQVRTVEMGEKSPDSSIERQTGFST